MSVNDAFLSQDLFLSRTPHRNPAEGRENNPAWLDHESRSQQLLEARACGEDAAAKRVTLSMTLVIQLFGEGVGSILPLDVLVDCPGEGMSEVVSLRRKSNTQAVLFCHEPLLSKIKGFSHHHRKWKRGEDSRLQDGTSRPTVILELGIKKEGSRSAFMGVFLNQGRWQSQIRSKGKLIFLGHFKSEMEAAQVYDSALIFKKGIKAKLNFPGEVPRPLSDVLKARMIADSKGKGKKVISPDKEEAVEEALRPEEEEEGEPAVLSGDISKSNLTTIAGQATPGSKAEKKNGIRVMMKVVYELFGPTVKLPLQVQVECDGEERQLVWLKRKADRYAAFFFNEPLRSKVKASHPHHRKWAMRREEGSDVPILSIQLRLQRDGTEKFLGVIQNRGLASGKFIAKAYVRGRPINIGCFSAAPDAARAYDAAARFLKGAEAMLNFPHEDPVLPNEEVKAKLLAASRLPPKGKRPNKVHNLEDDENEMLELVNEEDGEPVRYEDEDEDKDEEEDPYYSNVKRRRSAHNDPPVEIQEGDEDLASRAAAIALMSLLQ